MSDRDAFREAREHGLRARHETREARAVRKAVAEEIALGAEEVASGVLDPEPMFNRGFVAAETLQGYAADPYDVHGDAANGAFLMAAGVVRGMAKGHMHPPYGSESASDAISVPGEGPGTPEPSKAAKTPQEGL